MVTEYLHDHARDLVMGRNVLELGAGAGLPSLAAAIWGAEHVVLTDYPDEDLVDNMRINVDAAKDVLPHRFPLVVQVSLEIPDYDFRMLKYVCRDMFGVPLPNHCFQI